MFSFFVFALSSHADDGDFYPVTELDKKFLAEIVNAVQKRDTTWIAEHMVYPLSITISNETQITNTKEDFKRILDRELSRQIRTNIVKAAKKPLFKNWKGVMVGNRLVWFTESGELKGDSWKYGIYAIGGFAFKTSGQSEGNVREATILHIEQTINDMVRTSGDWEDSEFRMYKQKDLDGDRVDDAILLTTFEYDNSSYQELFVCLSSAPQRVMHIYVGAPGDRTAESLEVTNQLIILRGQRYTAQDGMCCPSQPYESVFSIKGVKIVQVR